MFGDIYEDVISNIFQSKLRHHFEDILDYIDIFNMNHIFLTYGDAGFESAKAKIVKEARLTGEFNEIYSYGRSDLSPELLASDVINIKRGGGLWSWKPDIILSTIESHQEGDIIVYCDAGCSLYTSSEWSNIWLLLEKYELIAQRIYQRTDHWTKKELLDAFAKTNGKYWPMLYQFQATIILKVSDFTRDFIREWRDLIIFHPEWVVDVLPEERFLQHSSFKESRHDQSIYSALVYKYLSNNRTKHKIYAKWEHIEDYDFFEKQAIRATRLRGGEYESKKHIYKKIFKRVVKDFLLKPFYFAPKQLFYQKKNLSYLKKTK